MPDALTTQEWLLAGAIPSQEFKKSHVHNCKQDPRLALFSASRFLWSLRTRPSGQVLKTFIIILDSTVESHLSNLDMVPPALSATMSLQQKLNKKKERKNHQGICFLTQHCNPNGAASWCLTCCCVKTVSSVFHGEIMPSNSPQFPIQFAHFGSARGPAPFNGSHLTKWTCWKGEVHPLFLGFSLYCCCFMPPPLLWIGSAEK